MMFHSPQLKVVLITVHVPLKDVSSQLTPALVDQTIALTVEAMEVFGTPRPRLALAGLNPHAGENGVLGDEDDRVLVPAVRRAQERGVAIEGPIPGDTVFVRASRGEFDCVIACYHDQGLIPVKLLAFGNAVNVTIGLPIIRTSVDHGTAFDIAGKGVADPGSMIAAVKLAAEMASRLRASRFGRRRASVRNHEREEGEGRGRERSPPSRSPTTARRFTTTTSSKRSRPASRCSAPR